MNQELFARVSAWVEAHREDLLRDIIRLARIPSVSDETAAIAPYGQPCRDALDEFFKIAKEHGFHTKNYDYHCGSAWLGDAESKAEDSVALWGHLDVVPAGDNWNFRPFEPVEKDGWLIGRGTGDNKGPAVADLYAALCLRELGLTLQRPLQIFAGCNEERGMADMEYFAAHYPAPLLSLVTDGRFPAGYAEKGIIDARLVGDTPLSERVVALRGGLVSNMVPDFAEIVLGGVDPADPAFGLLPKDFQVVAGEGTVAVQARGQARHSAFPEGGVNAISKLAHGLLAAGLLREDDEAALHFFTQVNLAVDGRGLGIACSDEVSGALTCVGSICSLDDARRPVLQINIRYPVKADQPWLLQALGESAKRSGFHFDLIRNSKPNDFPKEHPVVKTLTRVFNEVTGQSAEPFSMSGGTYARKLPRALICGMGIPDREGASPEAHPFLPPGHGGAHAPDEALNIDDLLLGIKILCMVLPEVDRLDLSDLPEKG
ncbi:MAG: Sapep family Mn(2+)-dependent dipeptidase [Clostridiales bacterium]|jgi:succinyl-diaminopimelate desuccinylase|nr:Sapep family Mn(2+)-dependent dipeptidase [Clostridiales bacterium]